MKMLTRVMLLPLIVGTLSATVTTPSPAFAQAAKKTTASTIVKKVSLTYLMPSEAVRLIQEMKSGQANKPSRKLPYGITKLTANDSESTLTIGGKASYVESLEGAVRFLDVKKRAVKVSARLIEIQLSEDGTPRETLLQSPIITTHNNTAADTGVSSSDGSELKLGVTPHINGDNSVSISMSLLMRQPTSKAVASTEFTKTFRLEKQGEWNPTRTFSLSTDKNIQKILLGGTEPIPAAAYPLYRLDMSAVEVP